MKKYFIPILASILLIGCKSQATKHTHHGETESHTHTAVNYFDSYSLISKIFGTKTIVTVTGNERKMVTNALPDHKTGAFPRKGNPNTISEQNKNYTFPVNPKYTGKATWVREPGVALNGVKFEPGTAEVVVCETGENYRVEAFQDVIDLGLDFNHAHVQPTGEYHYHGTPTSVIEEFDTGKDLVHVGFAHDGFPIYYSKSNAYKPSYKLLDGTREGEDCVYENPKETINIAVNDDHDGTYGSDFEYVANSGDLDECNGITIDGKYMYLVTNEFPYVSRCLMGEVKEDERRGPPRDGNEERKGGERKNFEELLEMMDTDKDGKLSKTETKGPLKEDFSKVDKNNDGFITKDELGKEPKKK
ncbi:YHYH protein [Polaribacter sp. HaHaR_3_91]|uniref:YHYH protein n=1 Tax=Polaribacter sp. HaHaR_3_91 TaxID=2745561 RepID=UPI001C4E8BA6|nr:YHYH protein [Polaribacter sp. HaHaR_3_91]QXP62352.1 YHYH protein [Polaribacter sp. HaHaR_3_91]